VSYAIFVRGAILAKARPLRLVSFVCVGDQHPDENSFVRPDNFLLAIEGVVAQTISS